MNNNYAAKRHRDGNNFGPSMIAAFGDFEHGELNVYPNDDRDLIKRVEDVPQKDRMALDIKTNLAMFNGNSAHEVDDFKGNRFSIVWFTCGCHAKADSQYKEALETMGMPYPAADESPYAILEKPQGYKTPGVFSAEHKRKVMGKYLKLWPRKTLDKTRWKGMKAKPISIISVKKRSKADLQKGARVEAQACGSKAKVMKSFKSKRKSATR